MSKKTVAVLFGGTSTEHEISLLSASTIISNLDSEKYLVLAVGIAKDGRWLLYNGNVSNILNGEWQRYATPAIISPDSTHKGIIKISGDKAKFIQIDVVIPALHGKFGEDGTIQGLLEVAKIPYVGCGVLASAVSMDKAYTKLIAKSIGVKQAKYFVYTKEDLKKKKTVTKEVEEKIGFPCFVKPSCAGSSVGITKVKDAASLFEAFEKALVVDKKIIVEENIIGREIECAVLGNTDPKASTLGEIIPAAEFYDYDAKYNNPDSLTVVPADVPEKISKKIRETAVKIFKAVDGQGLSRVDFFLCGEDIIFNEINTMPGFTNISMYKKLWEQDGVTTKELLDKFIELAIEKA